MSATPPPPHPQTQIVDTSLSLIIINKTVRNITFLASLFLQIWKVLLFMS